MYCTENGKPPNNRCLGRGLLSAFSETDQTGLEIGVEDLCFISMLAVEEALHYRQSGSVQNEICFDYSLCCFIFFMSSRCEWSGKEKDNLSIARHTKFLRTRDHSSY